MAAPNTHPAAVVSRSSRFVAQTRCRDAAVRICSSLLLLAVAIGFVLYELEYGRPGPPSFHDHLGPSWNLESFSSPPHHDGAHQHSEGQEDHEDGSGGHSHSAGTYHHAAAVTDSESCSNVAREVLQSGGSVVDAGVAATLCLAVVHPHAVSLGGAFASIYFNGTSQNASVLNSVPSMESPIPYGVPTILQGLWTLHQNHGRKRWLELFIPAIHLARQGFSVDSSLHAALEENQDKAASSEGLRGLLRREVGSEVRNVQLGASLEMAQSMRGPDLPDTLVHSLLQDLEVADREPFWGAISGVHPKSEEPLRLDLEGLTLYSSSPPTAGSLLTRSVQEVMERHQAPATAIADLLINASRSVSSLAGVWPPDPHWEPAPVRSSILIADVSGDVLVVSITLNSTFGSGFVSSSTGILLSDLVHVAPGGPRYWACPSLLLYGKDGGVVGLGGRGAAALPFSLAHVVVRHVLLEMELAQSINGTLTDLMADDPWLRYLQGDTPQTVMAIEVRAEHIHVATAQDCSCHPAGL
ncbi:glutathione hydrolase 6 isoform X2 [Dendropsophus ebraccatus]|uniref:glutathione hydrolase 6 isoform X2 n=1 Tax=Dendropsophus ebraccatus TaxID=150705 RepID=UPI0038316956